MRFAASPLVVAIALGFLSPAAFTDEDTDEAELDPRDGSVDADYIELSTSVAETT